MQSWVSSTLFASRADSCLCCLWRPNYDTAPAYARLRQPADRGLKLVRHMRIPPTRPRWEQAMERVVCELGSGVLKDSGRAAKVRADGGCAMIVKGWGDCPEPGLTTT